MRCQELSQLTQENSNILLQSKVDRLEQENRQLRYNNIELSKQYKLLRTFGDDDDDDDNDESDDSIRPAKRKKPSEEEERAKVNIVNYSSL
jgi:hypothetical protein